ncbi:hypothetical protein BJ912DRAFT_1069060 [Pholiota molesta]|nr:hypothetical protein BJ912DRAFT_1069060 [Pholiota molesta]
MSSSHGRPFFVERLKSFAGYASIPAIFDALSYWLPPFRLATSRYIVNGLRKWELWSPNSPRTAFYPSAMIPGFKLGAELPEQLRQCDGHVGHFDPTVSPQVLISSKLWYPFVSREGDPAARPEFTPFLTIWNESSSAVRPDFILKLGARITHIMGLLDNWQGLAWTHPSLWVARPLRPDSGDIAVLATHNDFPAALDTYAQIQRGIKLAAAWCRMAHALTQRPLGPPYNVNQVELVDESMMGAWINGSTEAEGRWLLEMRVPCFLIHEVESEVELSNAVNLSTRSSFTVGTAVMDLVLTKNPLDVVVLWNGGNLVDVAEDMWIASSVPPSLWHDRMRSSSYGQGWRRKLDKYVAPPTLPDLGFVERDGLIIPPAVMSAGTGPGHWTHWEEDQTEDGDFCFKRLGKEKGKANSGKMWYDHANRCMLYLESCPRTPRFYSADVDVFGLPAPQALYQEEVNGGKIILCNASTWMYKTRDPKCTDVGREHLPPLALHLDPDRMDETNDGFVPEPLPIRRPPSPIHRTASPFHRPESPKRRSVSPAFTARRQSVSRSRFSNNSPARRWQSPIRDTRQRRSPLSGRWGARRRALPRSPSQPRHWSPSPPCRRSPSPPRRKSVRAPSRDPDPHPALSVNILHEISVVRQERSCIQPGNSARTATPPSWD